eukprot:6337997-Amphidinium_carterae.1
MTSVAVSTAQWHPNFNALPDAVHHPWKMREAWEKAHLGVMCRAKLPNLPGRNRCFAQGICTCRGRGLKAHKAHQRLQHAVQTIYEKHDLKSGKAVLEFWQAGDSRVHSHLWFHVSVQCLSPLASVLLAMNVADGIEAQRAGNKLLKVAFGSPPWRSALSVVADFDLRFPIHVQGWELWESELHVNRTFSVTLVEHSETVVWRGSQERPIPEPVAGLETGADAEHAADMEESTEHADAEVEWANELVHMLDTISPPTAQSSSSSSSTSTSSSSSSSSGTSVAVPADQPAGSVHTAVAPAANNRRLQRAESFKWGEFAFVYRQPPAGNDIGAFHVVCRYHPKE